MVEIQDTDEQTHININFLGTENIMNHLKCDTEILHHHNTFLTI